MTLLAALIALAQATQAGGQDTVPAFRLEQHLPNTWDAFAEIENVEAFLQHFRKSPAAPAVKGFVEAIGQQTGKEPLKTFRDKWGASPEDFADLVKGQLAFGGKFGDDAPYLVTADCGGAEPAQKLADFVVKNLGEAKDVVIADVQAKEYGDGRVVAVAGGVLWLCSSRDVAEPFLRDAAKTAKQPLGDEPDFKKAKAVACAAPGGAFGYAVLGRLSAILNLSQIEALKQTGWSDVKAVGASWRFEPTRVEQTLVALGPENPAGQLAELLAMKGEDLALPAWSRDTAYGLHASKELVAFLQKIARTAMDAEKAPPEAEKALAPFFGETTAMNAAALAVGGELLVSIDGGHVTKVARNALDMLKEQGLGMTEEKVDGGTVAEFQFPVGTTTPVRAVGISGTRVVLGPDAKSVTDEVKGSNAETPDVKSLLEGAAFKGSAALYIDFARFPELAARFAAKPSGEEGRKVQEVTKRVLAEAGRSVEWLTVRDGALVIESRSTTGLALAALPWILTAAAPRAKEEPAHHAACEARIKIVLTALEAYRAYEGKYPTETGGALLDALVASTYVEADAVKCPDRGRFRGPAADLNTLGADAFIAACRHGSDVVALRKNGEVECFSANSESGKKVLKETKE